MGSSAMTSLLVLLKLVLTVFAPPAAIITLALIAGVLLALLIVTASQTLV